MFSGPHTLGVVHVVAAFSRILSQSFAVGNAHHAFLFLFWVAGIQFHRFALAKQGADAGIRARGGAHISGTSNSAASPEANGLRFVETFFLKTINNPASQTQCPYSPPSSSKKDALSPQRAWRTGPWHGTARGSDESCGVEPHTAAPRGDSVFFWNCFVVDDVGSSASGSGYCGDSGNEEGSRAGTGSPTTGAVYS